MTIKLTEEEFLDIVRDTLLDSFAIPDSHEITLNMTTYAGVEIVARKKKEKTPDTEPIAAEAE